MKGGSTMKKRKLSVKPHPIVLISLFVLLSGILFAQFDGSAALFVVASTDAPNDAEYAIVSRLEEMGFEVVMISQDAVTDDAAMDAMALVLISATCSSGTVAGNMPGLIDLTVPVINWEPFLYDAMGFQALDGGEFNSTDIEIVKADHPLAAGLDEGIYTITTAAEKAFSYGAPEGDAIIIAVNVNDPSQVVLFGYEAGAEMASEHAPARRVGTFLLNDVADAMTEEGWALFDASVKWAMNFDDSGTTVEQIAPQHPSEYRLDNNYPNPFNPATTLVYSIPAQTHVRLTVWNSRGEIIAVLADEMKEAGIYTIHFDATELPSGLYYYRLESGRSTMTKKMLLLR
jgi:hypothetical protein